MQTIRGQWESEEAMSLALEILKITACIELFLIGIGFIVGACKLWRGDYDNLIDELSNE
jgi:hypothetical protein